MLALKHLFDEGRVQINRPGAEAWVTEADVWLVSKIGGDLLRDWLIEQGVTSVPKNNNRVFDELQQHRLCIPTDADKAVWSVRVTAGDFDQRLTMLRFPIEAIWPDTDRRPPPLDGEVVPGSSESESSEPLKFKVESDVEQPDDAAPENDGIPAAESIDDLSVSTPQASLSDHCDSRDASEPASSQDGASIDWHETVKNFTRWLAEGVTKKRLKLNSDERTGDLWTVEEGLFIRTPGVIRDFATERGIADYVGLQRALERQNALLMNSRPRPTTKIYYEVVGQVKPLKGNVIINPESMLRISLPPPRAHLRRARGRDGYY